MLPQYEPVPISTSVWDFLGPGVVGVGIDEDRLAGAGRSSFRAAIEGNEERHGGGEPEDHGSAYARLPDLAGREKALAQLYGGRGLFPLMVFCSLEETSPPD